MVVVVVVVVEGGEEIFWLVPTSEFVLHIYRGTPRTDLRVRSLRGKYCHVPFLPASLPSLSSETNPDQFRKPR
jgi:hypothetical protein